MTSGIYPRWPFPDRVATREEAAVHSSESSSGVRQSYDRWGGSTRRAWRLVYQARPELTPNNSPGIYAIRDFWQKRAGPSEAFLMPSFCMEARLAEPLAIGCTTLSLKPYSVVTLSQIPFHALHLQIEAGVNDRIKINESPALGRMDDVIVTVPAGDYTGLRSLADVLTNRLNSAGLAGAYSVRTTVTERRFEIASTVTFSLLGLEREGEHFGYPDAQSLLGTIGFRNTENRLNEKIYKGRRSVTQYGQTLAIYDPHPSSQWTYGLAVIATVCGHEIGIDPLPTITTTFAANCIVEAVTAASFIGTSREEMQHIGSQRSIDLTIRESLMD